MRKRTPALSPTSTFGRSPRFRLPVQSIIAGAVAALVIGVLGWLTTVLASLAVGNGLDHTLAGLALFVSAGIGYTAIFVPLGYLAPESRS